MEMIPPLNLTIKKEHLLDMSILLWVLAVILIIVGIVGIIVPALPGVVLVFIGLLLAAWADGFQAIGWVTISVLAGLMVLALISDAAATTLGVKRAGASPWAVAGSMIGMVLGLFFGFVGIVIGPFVGAAAGEYFARRDVEQAGRAGLGTWAGIVLGTAVKLALAFSMITIFAVSYVLNR
jgi:uncharacterized protein YqgC (DUF456 family)